MLCSRYGVYLHCGYEHQFISPHNGVINTSFQHYAHHARYGLTRQQLYKLTKLTNLSPAQYFKFLNTLMT